MLSFKTNQIRIASLLLSFSIICALLFSVLLKMNIYNALASDFVSFYTGAMIVKEGNGASLYNLDTQFDYQQRLVKPHIETNFLLPYRNLPFMALFYIPFAFLPFVVGHKLFVVGIIVTLAVFACYSKKVFKDVGLPLGVWLLLTFLFFPNINSIAVAQFSPLIALIILFIYQAAKLKKDLLAGFLTGLLLIKPQYLLIAPFLFFLVKHKKNYFYSLVFTISLFLGISIFISGFDALANYPNFIVQTEKASFGSRSWHMFTFYSFLRSLPKPSDLSFNSTILINGLLYAFSLIYFTKKHERAGVDLSFISAILFTMVFSIHALVHDVSLLLVVVFVLLNLIRKIERARSKEFAAVAAIIFLTIPLAVLANMTYLTPLIMFVLTGYLLATKRSFRRLLP